MAELGVPPDAMDGELRTRTADRLVTLGRIPRSGEVEEGAAALHVAAGRPPSASGTAPPVIPVEALTRAQVVALQQALGVPGSGVMDEATRAALTAYQASRGRAATGALDVASVNELLAR